MRQNNYGRRNNKSQLILSAEETEIVSEVYDNTKYALGSSDKSELKKAFTKFGLNPFNGVPFPDSLASKKIDGTLEYTSEYFNKMSDRESHTLNTAVGIDIYRNSIMAHFTQMAINAFEEAIRIANLDFTMEIKRDDNEDVRNICTHLYGSYYDDQVNGSMIYSAFDCRPFIEYVSDGAPQYSYYGENLYRRNENQTVSPLFDFRIYRLCDPQTISSMLIPCLELNSINFKRMLNDRYDYDISMSNMADAYDVIIRCFNSSMINLLFTLENIVSYLSEEAIKLNNLGSIGNAPSISPYEAYDLITTDKVKINAYETTSEDNK